MWFITARIRRMGKVMFSVCSHLGGGQVQVGGGGVRSRRGGVRVKGQSSQAGRVSGPKVNPAGGEGGQVKGQSSRGVPRIYSQQYAYKGKSVTTRIIILLHYFSIVNNMALRSGVLYNLSQITIANSQHLSINSLS